MNRLALAMGHNMSYWQHLYCDYAQATAEQIDSKQSFDKSVPRP